jgi:small subunit ribosomal protein S16
MVKIRLKRMGSKFRPVYKIVAADARAPRDGKIIEALEHYNPKTKELVLNNELVTK